MRRINLFAMFLICIALVFGACGDKGDKPAAKDKPAEETKVEEATEDNGVVVAKAILEAYDKVVAEVYELVKDKPEGDEVKAQLKELYQKYTVQMQEMNVKYLALKDKDIALFGSANGYLGENRGKHVFEKDKLFDALIYHYQSTVKDDEMVNFLKEEPHNLLEVAIKRPQEVEEKKEE